MDFTVGCDVRNAVNLFDLDSVNKDSTAFLGDFSTVNFLFHCPVFLSVIGCSGIPAPSHNLFSACEALPVSSSAFHLVSVK